MHLIAYLRKSTDDSRHQKASIDDQRAWLESYVGGLRAKGQEIEIVRVFEERMTAKQPGRPLFGEMMALFYAGKADALAAWDIDRLSRNEVDEGTIKWALRQGKIREVHTHNTVYTEHELLTMGIFLSLGAEELAKLRQRIMRRMNAMVGEGKVPYRAPYGYQNHEGGAIPRESERRNLERMFALRTEGYSYVQIAEWLNERGIRTRSGGEWKHAFVERIISNDFYLGIVRFAGEVGEGIFERIVSRDLWEKANARKRTLVGYKKHGFTLKGIVVSLGAWKPLKASKIKGKYVYYHDDVRGITIAETEIFRKLASVAERWVVPENLLPDLESAVRTYLKKENAAVIAERKSVEKELAQARKRKGSLSDMRMDGEIDKEDYLARRTELILTEQKLLKDLEGLIALDATIEEEFQELVKLMGNLSVAYREGDDTLRGIILKHALVKLEVDEQKTLTVHEKELFGQLSACLVLDGTPNEIRTRVFAVRGQRPNR